MEKEKFRHHLEEATRRLIDFTKTLCFNDFSDNYKYIITPNSRTFVNNEEYLTQEEISVLKSWNKFEGHLLDTDEIIDLFHHNNKVPVWVDLTVYEARPDLTIIDLYCSRRLREEKALMHQGLHPFHLQVATPPDHLSMEIEGKFDVNWKKQMATITKTSGEPM